MDDLASVSIGTGSTERHTRPTPIDQFASAPGPRAQTPRQSRYAHGLLAEHCRLARSQGAAAAARRAVPCPAPAELWSRGLGAHSAASSIRTLLGFLVKVNDGDAVERVHLCRDVPTNLGIAPAMNDLARRAALTREVRQGMAVGLRTTIEVEVLERHGWWRITITELPGIEAEAHKRSDIQSAARKAIASSLQVPSHFFNVHLRFRD